jgi:eukaryotic-like serine/threonine-protein kinase
MVLQLLGDRYEVLRPIGAGAMTRVVEAWDRRERRRVALKVPIKGLAGDAAFLDRLAREAQTAASLLHPNIAATDGVGWDAGIGFVVTELVDGSSLGDMLGARGPLPAAGAARIATSVAAALAAAHARGVTHGHLTSSNVLLAIDGRVKVTDFRLAQAARPSDATADPAEDLAGLGRCLTAMLTGREPAAGAPIGLGPEVPAELAVIVQRTTGDQPSPYGSAAELVRDLHRFLTHVRPGTTHPAPTTPATHHRPVLAAWPSRSAGPLVPVTAARPSRRVTTPPGAPSARRRRALTLTVGLVVGCLGTAAGLLSRQPVDPLANQALPEASTAILATTTSEPTTGRPSAVTSSPTTVAADAASPPTSPAATTAGQLIGSSQRVVPDVVGLHRQQAADVLARAQLDVQLLPVQVSGSGQVQRVVGQRPTAGQVLPAGSTVIALIGHRKPTT